MKMSGRVGTGARTLEAQVNKALPAIHLAQLSGLRSGAVCWASDRAGLETSKMLSKHDL